jgi:hypothetical protein
MSIRFIRPVSIAARYAVRLAVISLLMLLGSWLAFRFGSLQMPRFILLASVAGGLALLSVVLAFWGLWRLWHVGAEGGIAATKALMIAAMPLGVLGVAVDYYQTRPMIYEIATDAADPVAWISQPKANQGWLPRPKADPQSHADEQALAYPTLTVRSYSGALDRVYQTARKIAADQRLKVNATAGAAYARPDFPTGAATPELLGADIGIKAPVPMARPEPAEEMPDTDNEPPGTIRVQATSRDFMLGFPFDVVIRLREEEDSVLVDMRVASRYGPHDLGLSADIANRYLTAMDGALLGIAGQ